LTLPLDLVAYGAAAAGFLVLTLLLLVSWEGRASGGRLITACVITTVWAALLAFARPAPALILLVEFLRYGAWFYVLTGLTRPTGIAAWLSRAVHVAWVGAVMMLVFAPLLVKTGILAPDPALLLANAGLLLSLLGLLLLEQIYRNSREDGRYAFKFLVFALGLMFSFDLFLYSQAQLLKAIEPVAWGARGLVTVLMVPLIGIAARRNPQWSLNLFVSRHVVFYSTSFMVVGVYLLLMALGGYWIRMVGGGWGRAAQLVFFAGAGVALAILLASGSLRRRLRVFLSQHFYRNKYDYRVEWLRFVGALSAPDEGLDPRENALRAISQVVNSPGGVLFMRSEEGGDFNPVAAWPRGAFEVGRPLPLPPVREMTEFLARHQWVIDLAELRDTPDAYENLPPTECVHDAGSSHDRRFRLVVPLTHVDELVGFTVLADPPGKFRPNYEDRDLLKTLGRHVAVHLAQFDADRRLAESRQFETYHRLTAFVMHDLRNLTAQLALIVSNAERHRRNPEFVDDAIGTIANSTARMQRLIEQLQQREAQSPARRVSLAEIARDACERCRTRRPAPTCDGVAEDAWIDADPERLTMIVEHVIRNAQEATLEDGSVVVRVSINGATHDSACAASQGSTSALDDASTSDQILTAELTVTDTGSGMSPEFVAERLFKPFETTKGSRGMGIGAYQVREYIRSLGGRVQVTSEKGKGTSFTLIFPRAIAGKSVNMKESTHPGAAVS